MNNNYNSTVPNENQKIENNQQTTEKINQPIIDKNRLTTDNGARIIMS